MTSMEQRFTQTDAAPKASFHSRRRLPQWLKRPLPSGRAFSETVERVAASGVATVCQEARCPNRPECWSRHTVTFMIMGDVCTRACRFCAVRHGTPRPLDPTEPDRLAEAAAQLVARHVVVTSVTRDDLPDEGAAHFATTIRAIRARIPDATVEVLTPDMHAKPEHIDLVCKARPTVYNHNIETVARLTPEIRSQADYTRSLAVLAHVTQRHPDISTKSGLLVGLGEHRHEINQTLEDLRAVGCRIVTIGQYLQPTPSSLPVHRYVPPDEFEDIGAYARSLGFQAVASAPFVRSSYNAAEALAAAGRRVDTRGQSSPLLGESEDSGG